MRPQPAMRIVARPMVDCHCGDVIVESRPILRRIPRTMRYVQTGVEEVRGVVIAEADPSNGWRITVNFPEGNRTRDTRWVDVELPVLPAEFQGVK